MTLSRATLRATTLLLLLLTGRGGAQDRGSAATRQQMMVITLDAIRRDDWRASEPIMQWGLLEAFTTELERNPGSPMAALVRQAGIRIDVTPRPIIARRADEVNIGIEQEPRLVLGRDIPYYADIYASIDGGQWFALNRVYDGKLCGSGSPRHNSRYSSREFIVCSPLSISTIFAKPRKTTSAQKQGPRAT